jgi:hypothetical protein
MLPFLKNKQAGGISAQIINRKPDVNSMESPEENDSDSGLKACAVDLINSIHNRDEKGVMEALRSAFEFLESQPHVENEELESEGLEE